MAVIATVESSFISNISYHYSLNWIYWIAPISVILEDVIAAVVEVVIIVVIAHVIE